MNKLTSLEIFAGCGGSVLGGELAGFVTSAAIEQNQDAYETLKLNRKKYFGIRSDRIILKDIRDIIFSSWGSVDLVCGGPPCQPFSTGGQHLGPKDGRNMFPEAIRCIREMQPRAFIFENVRGLAREKFKNYLEYLLLQLNFPEIAQWTDESYKDHHRRLEDHRTHGDNSGLEYNTVTRILNAADYGVPQSRERLFIIGFRSDEHPYWHFPDQSHSKLSLLFDQGNSGKYWKRHSLDAPETLPKMPHNMHNAELDRLIKLKPWETVRDMLLGLPEPCTEFNSNTSSLSDHYIREGARSYPGHTGSVLDLPSKTLKAGQNGVPGGENMLRDSKGAVRYFTIREMARLQSFPDEYQFCGSWGAKIKQIGNAVPVKLFEILAESVRKSLTDAKSV